jgi:hypothetical protein
MKISSMSQRDRRALFVGGAILIPSLLFVFVAKPYMNALANVREQTEQERDFLTREQALAKRLPTLPTEKSEASQRLRQEAARLFSGDDDLMATGNLAEYVATVADNNGVQLQQSETRNALTVAPGVRALQIEVRADGDVYGILHFLQQLESGDKLVRIGRLVIERGRSGVFDTSRVRAADVMSLSASVYGYRLHGVAYGANDSTSTGAPSPFARAAIDLPSMETVLNRNPFDPLRQAYGGNRLANDAPAQSNEPVLRLVGTVVNPNGESFAVCNVGTPTSKLVRVGEEINGYTLRSVAPKRAVFRTPDGETMTLETPTPGTFATSGAGRRNTRAGGPGSAINAEKTAEAAKQIAESQAMQQTIAAPVETIQIDAGAGMDSAAVQEIRRRIMDAMRNAERNEQAESDTSRRSRRWNRRQVQQQ